MQQIKKQLAELQVNIETAMERLNIKADQDKLEQLEAGMEAPDFWDDRKQAASISQQAAALRAHINEWVQLHKEVAMAAELSELGDDGLESDLSQNLERLQAEYDKRQFELKLSGEHDREGAILSIMAGAGGTDAQDWAEMLLRMYLRYAEARGWVTDVVDRSDGEEAGVKSVTAEISGSFAYGKLKGEMGVHRLVRLSPFNSDNLRQTSFAMVEVVPQLVHPEEFEVDEKDLRIDVFRAGGHGGQSVNTTDSAVRITHVPTGVVVTIQNERSQLQNKEKALAILKAKLTALMLEQQAEELSKLRGPQKSAEWGSQIRSYVLHPYTKVKDHRTGAETSQAQAVLDGDLEQFIDAYLSDQVGDTSKK
ncbi:MAG TPA: peptide chain release factor 2 [Candidatus Saccharimonadales bacterium]|nr:peptide chain release factor 2 [Candidatus Saccharimonadales bacterium]